MGTLLLPDCTPLRPLLGRVPVWEAGAVGLIAMLGQYKTGVFLDSGAHVGDLKCVVRRSKPAISALLRPQSTLTIASVPCWAIATMAWAENGRWGL